MDIPSDFSQVADFEDSGNFTTSHYSSDSYEEISSPESLLEYSPCELPELHCCFGCSGIIEDQFILRIGNQSWHPTCLRCSACHTILEDHSSCFIRDGNIYCKKEEMGVPCSKCNVVIRSNDWARSVHNNWYHLACFSCNVCSRQLATGEPFALQEQQLLCKIHYTQCVQGVDSMMKSRDRTGKRKAKRVRTAFTEEQIQVFQNFFERESNPDPEELDTLSEQTGLGRRVVQVWFQNARARSKKSPNSVYVSPASVSSKLSSSPEQSLDGFDVDLQDLITFQ